MDEGAAVLRKLAIRRVARLSGERSAWLTSDSSHATLSQCKVTAVTSSSHPPREHELKKKIIAVMAVGATSMLILPAMPAFYTQPKTLDDMIDFIVARICDQLGVEHHLLKRWGTPESDG